MRRLNCRQYFRVNVSNINLKGGGVRGQQLPCVSLEYIGVQINTEYLQCINFNQITGPNVVSYALLYGHKADKGRE